MRPHFKLLGLALTATVTMTSAFTSTPQEPTLKVKVYRLTGREATLTGTVKFKGNPPKPLTIDMSADPSCYESNPDPETEWFVVRNGNLANVLVYATRVSVSDAYSFEPPSSAVVLKHKGCRYEPHVLGIQTGQALMIVNSDPTHHNTHPQPKYNAEWNQTQPPGASPLVKTFAQAEVAMPIKDNQHPWESAYVGVFDHPFFAVSDVDGNYRIEGLPSGSYKVTAWHERLGEKTVETVFVPGESRYIEFAFSRTDRRAYK